MYISQQEDALPMPVPQDARTIEVFGNGMLPLYRHGDRLIVSESAPLRVGDRVIMRTVSFGITGGTLVHRDKRAIAIHQGGRARRDLLVPVAEVEFLGRVIWASQ